MVFSDREVGYMNIMYVENTSDIWAIKQERSGVGGNAKRRPLNVKSI